MGNSTTTCLTPNDNFIIWEDGLMTGTGVGRKEACSPIESLATPKSIRLGGEPQKKKEQHWVLAHGARQQWLLVTV